VKQDRYHSTMFDTCDYIRGLPFRQLLDTMTASRVIYNLAPSVFRRLIPTRLDKSSLVICRRLLSPFRSPHQSTKTNSRSPREIKGFKKMLLTNPRNMGPLTTFVFAYKSEPLMACSRFWARMTRRGRKYGERLNTFVVALSHAAGI
jgi:hypothetical protein